jgi:hypothetical protein
MLSGIGVECGMPGTAAGRVAAAALPDKLDNAAEPELVVAAELLGVELLAAAELLVRVLPLGVLLAAAVAAVDTPVSDAVPPTELQAASTTAIAARPTAGTLGRKWDILPFCQSSRSSARSSTPPAAAQRAGRG